MAIGAERKMLPAKGAVELQANGGRTFGDRQYMGLGVEVKGRTRRRKVRDVELVADRIAPAPAASAAAAATATATATART
jgi:hypothetical protein